MAGCGRGPNDIHLAGKVALLVYPDVPDPVNAFGNLINPVGEIAEDLLIYSFFLVGGLFVDCDRNIDVATRQGGPSQVVLYLRGRLFEGTWQSYHPHRAPGKPVPLGLGFLCQQKRDQTCRHQEVKPEMPWHNHLSRPLAQHGAISLHGRPAAKGFGKVLWYEAHTSSSGAQPLRPKGVSLFPIGELIPPRGSLIICEMYDRNTKL